MLGPLTLLIGIGTERAVEAALIFLLVHALYKMWRDRRARRADLDASLSPSSEGKYYAKNLGFELEIQLK